MAGACLTAVHSVPCLAAVGFGFLKNCKDFLVDTLVVLHLDIMAPELHRVASMTNLSSLTLTEGTHEQNQDKLTLLQGLAKLHTLHLCGIHNIDLTIPRLQSLRRLSLNASLVDFYDFTSCTQLTSLAIASSKNLRWVRDLERIHLPTGSNVQLQNLAISGGDCYLRSCFELHNLQDATHLTSIELCDTYPVSFNSSWPLSMPCLKTIKCDMLSHGPPQQLLQYPQLRHLSIHCVTVMTMPTWFSQLTQLDTLCICADTWSLEFPGCLLQLRQLSSLDLICVQSAPDYVELPTEIVQFSEFTALTRLHMRWSFRAGESAYSSKAQQQLTNL